VRLPIVPMNGHMTTSPLKLIRKWSEPTWHLKSGGVGRLGSRKYSFMDSRCEQLLNTGPLSRVRALSWSMTASSLAKSRTKSLLSCHQSLLGVSVRNVSSSGENEMASKLSSVTMSHKPIN
jgi:hypothetical protein